MTQYQGSKGHSDTSDEQMTDDELFIYFDELLEAQIKMSCRNTNCRCLKILNKDDRVCAAVGKYLARFERKNKHGRIVLSWIGTGLLRPQDMGTDKFGTACRAMELGAQTWRMFSTKHKLINCVQKGCVQCWVLEMRGTN